LNLLDNDTFMLSREWLGEAGVQVDLGTWAYDADANVLTLTEGEAVLLQFERLESGELRQLDRYSQPIASELPYELSRADSFQPLANMALINGMFSYMADAAVLTECKTGKRMPVAMEQGYLELERAYTGLVEGGGKILVSFVGDIEPRPAMEGDANIATAIVERYAGIWPVEQCSANIADSELYDTYWKIERLGDKDLEGIPGIREPRLILRSQDQLYSATVGCNSISGGYSAGASQVSFQPGRTTLMACLPPVSPLEIALVDALGRAQQLACGRPALGIARRGGGADSAVQGGLSALRGASTAICSAGLV
jgi:uncharacterized lipoprotein NlpE involved in copper resistance/heat shock protein HslJ